MVNIFSKYKSIFFLSNFILIIEYLYPGSLIGYFLYGNLGTQPNIISNPIGTSINHLIYFSLITVLSNIVKNRLNNLFTKTKFILFLSIFLELSHLIVPNRAFVPPQGGIALGVFPNIRPINPLSARISTCLPAWPK